MNSKNKSAYINGEKPGIMFYRQQKTGILFYTRTEEPEVPHIKHGN